jgi:quinol monooxygenase YgiN
MATTTNYLAVHQKGVLTEGSSEVFYKATLECASKVMAEADIARFDLLRSVDNEDEFLLLEVFQDRSRGPDDFKQSQLYQDWREVTEPLMAAPPASSSYTPLFPTPSIWDTNKSCSVENVTDYQSQRPWDGQPLAQSPDGGQGGLLASLYEITVSKMSEDKLVADTLRWCYTAVKEAAVQRVDFLANSANHTSQETSSFLLVVILNTMEPSPPFLQQFLESVAMFITQPIAVGRYMTLYPAPLYYRTPSALTHEGEGQRYLREHLQSQVGAENTAAWGGKRGLGTTNLTAGMFSFQGPKIVMGRGVAATAVRDTLKALKLHRPLIVTGAGGLQRNQALFSAVFPNSTTAADTSNSVDAAVFEYEYTAHAASVSGEPTIEDAQRIVAFAAALQCDAVLAVGGGSALDVGKAVAALVPNAHRDIMDFLEVIGRGLPLERDPLPVIAVPTTSGTGSEATKNAVLKSVTHGLKVSIRHEKMYPVAAILDATLTLSCPPSVTAHVGMDTLCQCLEPFLCCVPNPFVDALAREVTHVLYSLLHVCLDTLYYVLMVDVGRRSSVSLSLINPTATVRDSCRELPGRRDL